MDPESEENIKIISEEDLSIWWKAACFLFPLLGLVLYFINGRNGLKLKSKSAITAAIAGIILNLLMYMMDQQFSVK